MLGPSDLNQFVSSSELLEATPSFHCVAYKEGLKLADIRAGAYYKYYDIASLTKIVFTTTLFMEMVENSEIELEQDLSSILGEHYKSLTIKSLLTHSAGHRWWAPLYKELLDEPANCPDSVEQWGKLEKILLSEKREQSPEKFIYSDIDFLLLGQVLRQLKSQHLDQIFSRFSQRWGLTETFFAKQNIFPAEASDVAPTEFSEWRSGIMQGKVHDENTFSLGGISSHAGLFSTMTDLEKWALEIRKSLYTENGLLRSATLKDFTSRHCDPAFGDWALGFMMPSETNSSCGQFFSKKSFGHTGFTGTSFWMDPEEDLFVIILSNRVNPSRENRKFVALRGRIHDAIFQLTKDI